MGNAVARPVRAISSTVTGIFERIYSSIYRYDALMERYLALVSENAQLHRDFREAAELAERYDLLRAQLGFRERNPDRITDLARFTGWSGSNWSHSFTINRGGSNSNIQRGNAVVTEEGILIGRVTDVGTTTSTVVTVLDTTFSAGAFVGDGDGSATIRGDFSLMRNGLMMLDQIDDTQIVRIGDTVVTSGLGDIFPRGLIVGEVVDLHMHATGIGRYATVRPTRVFDALQEVFVITDFDPADD
jgi:rod shape-determining protein MreC